MDEGRRRSWSNVLLVAVAAVLVAVFAPRMCGTSLLAPGTTAPPFSLPRVTEPGRVTLGDLQGHRAVLFFWAVWCRYCKQMMPGLAALARERPDVRFVAVHADPEATAAELATWARRFPELWFAAEGERIVRDWRVGTFPTTYLLDATGRICGGFVGQTSTDVLDVVLGRCRTAPGGSGEAGAGRASVGGHDLDPANDR
jgi:thiol-disulfide isomerase/thioredoxin